MTQSIQVLHVNAYAIVEPSQILIPGQGNGQTREVDAFKPWQCKYKSTNLLVNIYVMNALHVVHYSRGILKVL